MNEYLLAFWFYIVFSLLGGFGFFLAIKIFPQRKELAYFLAKPLGLAVFGYVIWFLGSLKILSYQSTPFIVSLFLVGTVAGFFYAFKQVFAVLDKKERKKFLKHLIWLEVLSLGLYLSYLYIRSFNAAAYGTERFMDMALVNSSLKTNFFPFSDPWYSSKAVNYYYYGHYLVSLLTKLSGISTFLTYNFALGLLYSVSALLSGLLSFTLYRSKSFAVLAGFLVTTGGSIFYASCVLGSWFKGTAICSYASSTRFYSPSYIINEIPSYSFTVGDLHAHFLALPFFLLNLIFIYALFEKVKPTKLISIGLLVSIITSALINPSDATTLALLLSIVGLWKVFTLYKSAGSIQKLVRGEGFKSWLWLAIFLGIGGFILYFPFFRHFISPVLGFGIAPIYAAKHNFLFNSFQYPTPFLAFLGEWGVFVLTLGSVFYSLRKKIKEIGFAVVCFVAGLFLILFVELFFVRDIYSIANPPYFRANTVFKYGYHIWVMLSIGFSAALGFAFKALSEKRKKHGLIILRSLLTIFVVLSLFYPYQAIKQFYPSTKGMNLTLDAAAFMQKESMSDKMAVDYINQNIKNRLVVLEAVGDSYSYFGRMSVFTGQATPMGWMSHEWTWHFDGKEAAKIKEKDPAANVETGYGAVAKIGSDVRLIYETPDSQLANQLIKSYGVSYVYIGNLERKTYPYLQEGKFFGLGQVVFESGDAKLFKIH